MDYKMITVLNKKQILKEKGVIVSSSFDDAGKKYHIYSYTNPDFCLYVAKDKKDLLNQLNTYSDSVFFYCGMHEIKLDAYTK